ncbi:MAG: DUF1801 domain-containing protein [Litoreibacter sp.]|uniref:DUF1801 domain-containing protein n=1 Tax=Litoreibacter sp. TaxID=1969459 RepID=UPI0032989F83
MSLAELPPVDVLRAFEGFPPETTKRLLAIRQVIYQTAETIAEVGPLTETLKWREPAYLTNAPKTGTTIRLAQLSGQAAMMVPCSTTIIEDARARFGDLPALQSKRGVLLDAEAQVIDYVINAALTYHLRR